ncbi:MAG: helix-turn-helix domain-containing protein [bacterium]
MNKLLKPAEIAEIINVSLNTIYTWVYNKKIPHMKIGGALRFSEQEIIDWIEKSRIVVEG